MEEEGRVRVAHSGGQSMSMAASRVGGRSAEMGGSPSGDDVPILGRELISLWVERMRKKKKKS